MQGVSLLESDIGVVELSLLLPYVRMSVAGSGVLRKGVIWKGMVRVVVTVACWGGGWGGGGWKPWLVVVLGSRWMTHSEPSENRAYGCQPS